MLQSRSRTAEQAIGHWPGILQALGVGPQFLRSQHGPCPICRGTDRYRFDNKDGRGTWICSQCGAGDGFDLLMTLYQWRFAQAAKEVDQIIGSVRPQLIVQERTEEAKVKAMFDIWNASKPVMKGDPVWLYLDRRIGIDSIPDDIRFHSSLHHTEGGSYPAMLALMRYPNGEAASIHRTYLTADGHKAPVSVPKKFMQGKPLSSSSVRLGTIGVRVGIAEGIETTLAAIKRFGGPFVAATNATLLEAWEPPPGVSEILIAGDNDMSYTGQAAAFSLAKRLVHEKYRVEVVIPPSPNTDWADIGMCIA